MDKSQELILTKLGEGLPAITPSFGGELRAAERLIAIALSGNPPQEIAEEVKDLFIKINLRPYLERHGLSFDEEKLRNLMGDKQGT